MPITAPEAFYDLRRSLPLHLDHGALALIAAPHDRTHFRPGFVLESDPVPELVETVPLFGLNSSTEKLSQLVVICLCSGGGVAVKSDHAFSPGFWPVFWWT